MSDLLKTQPTNLKTLVINIGGGPGTGKSTAAWEIASDLKKQGFTVEYVGEVAKDCIYDALSGNAAAKSLLDGSLASQKELYRQQTMRVSRLKGKVDFIVTDSPAIIALVYVQALIQQTDEYRAFKESVLSDFLNESNFNLLVRRGVGYQKEGRIHTLIQAKEKDREIAKLLTDAANLKPYKQTTGIFSYKNIPKISEAAIKVYKQRLKN